MMLEVDAWRKTSQTMKRISLSNDTIKSQIHKMPKNIKSSDIED